MVLFRNYWTLIPSIIFLPLQYLFCIIIFHGRNTDPQITVKVLQINGIGVMNTVIRSRMGFLLQNADLEKDNSFINCDNPLFLQLKQMSFTNSIRDVIMHLLYLFRIKSDAVPGRLNQYLAILIVWYLLWAMFELCGVNHGFMPIEIVSILMAAAPVTKK